MLSRIHINGRMSNMDSDDRMPDCLFDTRQEFFFICSVSLYDFSLHFLAKFGRRFTLIMTRYGDG